MKFGYRKAYLTDGTQVKITEELFQQLKTWEQEGYAIPFTYADMLKKEDNEMIKADRKYYTHNVSLDDQVDSALMHDKRHSISDYIQNSFRRNQIMKVLNLCTETQRRRFIKHYYLGYSYAQIARQERCCRKSIYESIQAVEKLLINCEQI